MEAGNKQYDANFILVNIEGYGATDAAKKFASRNGVVTITHLIAADAPKAYGLRYIPHHVVIDQAGKVK